MLMEAAPKLVSSIIVSRINKFILVKEWLEEQNDFMPNRGCRDGISSLKLALQKRREHGLDTWAVFVDLVKAFDSVFAKLCTLSSISSGSRRKWSESSWNYTLGLLWKSKPVTHIVRRDWLNLWCETVLNKDAPWHRSSFSSMCRPQLKCSMWHPNTVSCNSRLSHLCAGRSWSQRCKRTSEFAQNVQ